MIDPSKFASFAYLMSGAPSGMKKTVVNVRLATLSRGGYPRLFLYSIKDIMEGDLLYWNYGAVGTKEEHSY